MSVITTADERKKDAISYLKKSREAFEKCIDSETWGADEWSKDFKEQIIDIIHELRKIELNLEH